MKQLRQKNIIRLIKYLILRVLYSRVGKLKNEMDAYTVVFPANFRKYYWIKLPRAKVWDTRDGPTDRFSSDPSSVPHALYYNNSDCSWQSNFLSVPRNSHVETTRCRGREGIYRIILTHPSFTFFFYPETGYTPINDIIILPGSLAGQTREYNIIISTL